MLYNTMHNRVLRLVLLVVGELIAAAALNLFIVPLSLYTGGLMGLCQLIRTLLQAQLGLEPGAGDKLLERMTQDGTLAVAGRCLALPTFQVAFTPEQEALKDRLYQACAQEPFAPPERSGLTKEMGRAKDFQKVLDYLTDEGELVPLEPDLLFTRKAVEEERRNGLS